MKKTSVALAVGAALAAQAAWAQSANVQIYGKLYPSMLYEKGSGASPTGTVVSPITNGTASGTNALGSTIGMVSGNSRFGFRGQEDLGSGLKAIWQIESPVSVDQGSGQIAGRDTFVGLQGGFGTVRLGNMDTIFKNYGDTLGFLGVSSGTWLSTSDVLRKVGFGVSSASSFHLRRANSVVYETPEIAGFQAGVQWSSNEAKTATRDPKVLSFGIKYDEGPFYFAIAHEIHDDLFGGSQNAPAARRNTSDQAVRSEDTATQATIEYRLGKNHKFEFDYIRKKYDENATVTGRFREYRNNAYLFAMENRWTEKWRTALQYVKSEKGSCALVGTACFTDGLEGSKYAVGAAYYFSRRTYGFGAVGRINNGKAARYNNAEFSTPNPGEDITHVALGIAHSF